MTSVPEPLEDSEFGRTQERPSADRRDLAVSPSDLICKGSWSLGTACGKCGRCYQTAPAEIARLRQAVKTADGGADMYAKAWQRELGSWMWAKRHHIDACVIGTRKLVEAERQQRVWIDGLRRWQKDAGLARTLGVPDPDLVEYLPALDGLAPQGASQPHANLSAEGRSEASANRPTEPESTPA